MSPTLRSLLKHLAVLPVMGLVAFRPAPLQAQAAQARPQVSPACPGYVATATVTGVLDLPGAEELSELGDEWNHGFQTVQPDGGINFQPRPTREIIKALVEGTSPVGITAREFTPEETKAFKDKFGYLPMRFPVCMDANLIFVHKDNPLTSISMEQLDAIYGKARLGGAKAPVLLWGDLGVKGALAKHQINAYTLPDGASRESFANLALLKGEFRPGVLPVEDAFKAAEAILSDPAGIAYGTFAAWYTANKVLPVVPFQGKDSRFPNQDNITSSRYPMARLYHVYVNRAPGKALEPRLNEVLHYILSSEGQNKVADVGIMPGPVEFLTIALKRLDR